MQRSYELVEVKDGRATIKIRSALITPIRDGMILAQLIQMSPCGTIVFDLENGRINLPHADHRQNRNRRDRRKQFDASQKQTGRTLDRPAKKSGETKKSS